jgi:uncharacterized protein YndB with AHSA1/START domain
MRIAQTFHVAALPERVFDYMTDPANLRAWQTSKTRVEVLSDGPPGPGYRLREWTKVPGRAEFEQVVEFDQFERPTLLHTHIVEGPQPLDGMWTLRAADGGTRVEFVAEGSLQGAMRFAVPIVALIIGREFRGYHENLRRNVEALP